MEARPRVRWSTRDESSLEPGIRQDRKTSTARRSQTLSCTSFRLEASRHSDHSSEQQSFQVPPQSPSNREDQYSPDPAFQTCRHSDLSVEQHSFRIPTQSRSQQYSLNSAAQTCRPPDLSNEQQSFRVPTESAPKREHQHSASQTCRNYCDCVSSAVWANQEQQSPFEGAAGSNRYTC